jgi:hypothetical protein
MDKYLRETINSIEVKKRRIRRKSPYLTPVWSPVSRSPRKTPRETLSPVPVEQKPQIDWYAAPIFIQWQEDRESDLFSQLKTQFPAIYTPP